MRVLALAASRLRGALSPRAVLAPCVALVVLQLVGLAGGSAPASALLVTSSFLALPALAWLARQVLDAEPDDQVLLSTLAVGGPVRAAAAGLLAAAAVAVPAALLCAWAALLRADQGGVPVAVLLEGSALTLLTALAAVAIGAYAARAVAGPGAAPVLVLVGAPVLVAVLGLPRHSVLTALVPRLDAAVRATNPPRGSLITPNEWFVPRAPAVLLQVLLWTAVVVAVRLLVARRRG